MYYVLVHEGNISILSSALPPPPLPQCLIWASCRDRMVVGFPTICAISAYHH